MSNLLGNRIEKARRIVGLAETRGVMDQARTYSNDEWRELAVQAGESGASDDTIEFCRLILSERAANRADPFRGLV